MQILNIEIEENSDYTFSVMYSDETTNLPIDITGYSALLQVRMSFGSDSILLELSSVNGRIALNGASGFIDVTFLPQDTNRYNQGSGWTSGAYDLILTDTGNKKKKLLKGFVTVARSSTI